MEKEFVPYEQALALKELGFKEPCIYVFLDKDIIRQNYGLMNYSIQMHPDGILAPLYQQVFRWFRDKYELYFNIHRLQHAISTKKEFMLTIDAPLYGGYCESYEEAELACLKKLIEIAKSL